MLLHCILPIALTKPHGLIAFTSWDIEQYVHSSYLFYSRWCYQFWNYPWLSYQALFLHDRKTQDSQGKNLNILTLKRLGINFISPVAFPKKYLPDGVKTCSFVIFNIIIIHYFVEHRCIFVQMNRYGCPKIKPKFFRKKHSKRT